MPAPPHQVNNLIGPWLDDSAQKVIDAEIVGAVGAGLRQTQVHALLLGDFPPHLPPVLDQAGWSVDAVPLIELEARHLAERSRKGRVPDVAFLIEPVPRAARILGDTAYRQVLRWLAEKVPLSVLSAPRQAVMPGIADLGRYRAHAIVDEFLFVREHVSATTQASLISPRLVASSTLLHQDGGWEPITTPTIYPPSRAGARTWSPGSGLIVKTEAASEDYFERSQVGQEGRFLARATPEHVTRLRLPALASLTLGRAVNTLIRGTVEGTSLANHTVDVTVLNATLSTACAYAQAGLFHNDIRPWNVIWNGSQAQLIDYADVRTFESDTEGLPQILALATCLTRLAHGYTYSDSDFSHHAWTLWHAHPLATRVTTDALFTVPWIELGKQSMPSISWESPGDILTSLLIATLNDAESSDL